MNIKKLYALALLALPLSVACSEVDGDGINQQTGLPNAVYFTGVETTPMTKLIVDENGASGEFSVRTANLLTGTAVVTLQVDSTALEAYNAKYGTAYQVLPAEYYTLSESSVTINPESVTSRPVGIQIKPSAMDLDPNTKYAVPLRLVGEGDGNNIAGVDDLKVLASADTKILGLDRPVYPSVFIQRQLYLWAQLDEPIELKEWTIAYGFRVDRLFDNQAVFSSNAFYSRLTSNGALQFKVGETDDPKGFFRQKFERNKWYHIAFVYKDAHVKAYINGVLDTEFDVAPVERFERFNFSWGAFSGLVRDIRVYRKALSPFLINENLYVDSYDNPNLVLYYPLTKETGIRNVVEDKNHFIGRTSERLFYPEGTLNPNGNQPLPADHVFNFQENVRFPQPAN